MDRIKLDVDNIVKLYQSGLSEKALAERLNVNRGTIRRRLLQAGVVCRGRSESMYVRMASLTADERQALTNAAHKAVRGKKQTYQQLVNRAKAREGSTSNLSPYEREIAAEFALRHLPNIPQKAVGKYNLDFLVGERIAFEIFGGNWHFYGRHALRFGERDKFVRDSGYVPVYCVIRRRDFDAVSVCDYLVRLLQVLSSDPASVREKYMIWGNGDDISADCFEFDNLS